MNRDMSNKAETDFSNKIRNQFSKNWMGKKKLKKLCQKLKRTKLFWSNIWSQEKQYKTESDWLKTLNEESGEYHQEDLKITEKRIRDQCRKILGGKVRGQGGDHGFWLKNLTALHKRITKQKGDILSSDIQVPVKVTKGRAVLCQKDRSKGNAVGIFPTNFLFVNDVETDDEHNIKQYL